MLLAKAMQHLMYRVAASPENAIHDCDGLLNEEDAEKLLRASSDHAQAIIDGASANGSIHIRRSFSIDWKKYFGPFLAREQAAPFPTPSGLFGDDHVP